jgi:hypothetical protein
MRKPSCIARLFGGVVTAAVLVLLAAAAYYGYLAVGCWKLKPSGNGMYDQFAQAVRARQALRLYGGLGRTGVLLEPASVAAWEAQYADEPSYWQLRYWVGMARYVEQREAAATPPGANAKPEEPSTLTPYQQRQLAEKAALLPRELLDPLQHAIDENIADAAAYLLAYEGELAAMDPAATVEVRAPMLKLLDRALDIHPDWSWGYYLRALHRLDVLKGEAVDWVAVRSDLIAGNAAERNYRPLAFPQSYVEEQLADRGQPAGDEVLAGAVLDCGAQIQELAPLERTVSRTTLILLEHCAQEQDLQLVGEWARCLCRISALNEATPKEKAGFAAALRMVARYLNTRFPAAPTSEQRQDVYEVSRWMNDAPYVAELLAQQAGQVQLDWLEQRRWPSPGCCATQLQPKPELARAAAGIMRSDYYHSVYTLRGIIREELFPKFDRLVTSAARFDFYQLRLPYDLSPVNIPKDRPGIAGIPAAQQAPAAGASAAQK